MEAPFSDFPLLQSTLLNRHITSLAVFSVTWALTLRVYLGVDAVRFGVSTEGSQSKTSSLSPLTLALKDYEKIEDALRAVNNLLGSDRNATSAAEWHQ